MYQPLPSSIKDDNNRLARVLSILIIATWLGYLFVIILGFFFQDYALIGLTLIGSAMLVFPMVMLRHHKLQISSLSLIVIELATITFIATVGQGIRDLAILGLPIIILFAGLVLDKVFFRISFGLIIIAVFWLSLGEIFGLFVTKPFEGEASNWFYLVGMTVILSLAALAVDLLTANIRMNLERAQAEISQRKLAEEEFRKLNTTLELRVEKRTQELREAQELLVKKEKLATLGVLAGSVGHELRNPLGVINTSIYYLKLAQPDATEKVKRHHAMIEQEVQIANKIISDLLDFGRVITSEPEQVSIQKSIQKILDRFPLPVTVQLVQEFPANLPEIYFDPYHLEQILINLFSNACKAMNNEGSLTISLRRIEPGTDQKQLGEMTVISLKDTGSGIRPEHLDKIFEPLFTTKIKGIGLGLAVSQKLAQANGGWLEVESEVGKGSTFSIYAPLGRFSG